MATELKKQADTCHLVEARSNSDSTGGVEEKALEEKLAAALRELSAIRGQKAALESQLHGILSSRSWKLTSPIRRFSEFKRAVSPLWNRADGRCTLTPARNILGANGVYAITGPSPILTVAPENGIFPSGWVRVSAELNTPMIFSLYYRTGEEFSDSEKIHVPLIDTPAPSRMIRLPTCIKELRLQPFISDGTLAMKSFSLTSLGSVQVVVEVAKRQLAPHVSSPKAMVAKAKKAYAIYKEGGIYGLKLKLFSDSFTGNYQDWITRYDTLSQEDRVAMRAQAKQFNYRPLISIVIPTYNTPTQYLEAAIESVRTQTYDNWELCIADDASTLKETKDTLARYQALDARIKVVYRKENGHISRASNTALELAQGEYIGLLDHDDTLTEDALFCVVSELQGTNRPEFLFSDEDMITGFGMRYNPHFKSDWNPFLFLSQNYICHFSVIKAERIRAVGGFRVGVEGAQDWDLFLRVIETLPEDKIFHIPHVLYHWRAITGSTAQSTGAKPYVLEAQKKSVSEHLARRGIDADIEILHSISHLRAHFKLPKELPLVSIIIPTKDQLHHLERCIESLIGKNSYKSFEIIIVDNGSSDPNTLAYLEKLPTRANARVMRIDEPFNYSRLNNLAAKEARGDLLCLMNNDIEIINPDALSEMVAVAMLKGVGGVGARLLYPNNLLQHGGVILGIGGVAGHNHKGRRREDPGYFNRAILPQNLSAVTAACLMLPRRIFDEVGGLDEGALSVGFNDVDLCLKIRKAGYQIVYASYAEFYHFESASRGYENTPEKFRRFEKEVAVMKERWRDILAKDPYYNPNLTLLTEDFQFAFPPRVKKPWKNEVVA